MRVAVASHAVRLAEGVDRVRGEPVVVARHRRRVAHPLEAALEQQHLGAPVALTRLPVHHGHSLVSSPEGLLARAGGVADVQPEQAVLLQLDRCPVGALAAHRHAYPLGQLVAVDHVQHDRLALHIRLDTPLDHQLLERRGVAHPLGGEALAHRDRGLPGRRRGCGRRDRRGCRRHRRGRRLRLCGRGGQGEQSHGDREQETSVHGGHDGMRMGTPGPFGRRSAPKGATVPGG